MKLLDASVLHKTEIGGVHLGVATPERLDAALDALEAVGARRYLIESMALAGVDLLHANPHLTEIEINPLRLTAHGLVALDAVAVAKHPEVPDAHTHQ